MERFICHIVALATLFIIGRPTVLHAQTGRRPLTTEALWQQCEQARSLSHYDSLRSLSKELKDRAFREQDTRMEAYAHFYQGLAHLFTGQKNDALRSLNLSRDKATEIENDSVLALVTNAMGIFHAMTENNNFVAQQFFFKSLEYAEKARYEQLKGRIYGNLLILTHSGNDTTGLDNAVKIYDYGKKNNDFEQTFMGAYYLAMYYNLKGENVKAEKYIQESLRLYERYRYDDIASVYTLYSKVKNDMGDLDAAEHIAETAITLAQQYNQAFLLPDAYLQHALVLHEKGQFARSNEVTMQALSAVEQSSGRTKSVACYELIAKNCQQLGLKDQALEYLGRANRSMDTLSAINMERLRHEQDILNDIVQKEQDARVRKQQMEDQRKLNLTLVIALVLLSGLLAVIVASYRRRNRLYKNIVRQNAHAVNDHDELQARIDKLNEHIQELTAQAENKDQSSSSFSPETETNNANKSKTLVDDEERAQELYDRACMLMKKERLFTDPQLNRERFAEILGTNRTYLSKILKEKSGMTYLQFVNSHRINEAIRLLSDPNTQSPLKQIWKLSSPASANVQPSPAPPPNHSCSLQQPFAITRASEGLSRLTITLPFPAIVLTRWWNCVSMAATSWKMSAWSNSRLFRMAVLGR